ncbi:pentapeptide repeat-containing protein [Streptomyces tauricus]|uniref:pentapeptide repeat-containing protein n=1 Tax=Streptomyces tauricus TaxID=68274 RepID=UPI0033A084AA
MRSTSLERAALTSSDLVGADLTDARFDRAVMLNAIMNKAILTGATLAHADLSGATLNEAQFERANLTRVRLVGARLADTNFHGANLTHADLSHAGLRRAILDGARLHYKDFDGADLRETKLDKATGLEAGKLIKARIDHTTSLPSHLSEDPAVQVCIADWEAAADEEAEARVPDVDWEPGRQEM